MTNEIIGTAVLLSLAAIFSLINLKGYWIAVLLRVYSFLLCILAAFYYLTTLPGKKIRFQPLILAYNTIIPNLETSLISLSLFSGFVIILQISVILIKINIAKKRGMRWNSFWKTTKIISKKNNGLVLYNDSRLSEDLSFKHLTIVAPTGTGKTTKFTIPNLLEIKDYSIIVTDPSGELHEKTANILETTKDVSIIKLAPFEEGTEQFNPLEGINTLSKAKQIATTLTTQLEGNSDPFWSMSGGTLLTSMILLANEQGIPTFSEILNYLSLDKEELNEIVASLGKNETDTEEDDKQKKERLRIIRQEYSLYRQSSEQTGASILATAKAAISIFSDENFAAATQKNTVDFKMLRNKRCVLYLIIPEDKISYSAPFLSLFYNQIFSFGINNKEGLPLYFILEEFANIGKIPNFSEIINVARKRNISITTVLQDLNQFQAVYKEHAESILSGGTVSKLFYPGLGTKSAQYVSELLGKKNEEALSQSKQSKSVLDSSESSRREDKPLLSPEKIRTLNSNDAIFVTGNNDPIYIKNIIPYYRNKKYKHIG